MGVIFLIEEVRVVPGRDVRVTAAEGRNFLLELCVVPDGDV